MEALSHSHPSSSFHHSSSSSSSSSFSSSDLRRTRSDYIRLGRDNITFFHGSSNLTLKLNGDISPSPRRRRPMVPEIVAMSHSAAAGGYAAALAETGRSQNALDTINSDIHNLGSLLNDPNLHSFLVNPTVLDQHKKNVLQTLAQKAGFSPYTLNLLNLIVDRKRTTILKDIVAKFEELYDEMTDTEVAIVTSAVKIETARLAEIAKKVHNLTGAKNVRMKNVVDSSLVAGFVVRFGKDGSRFVDMSVKSQLARIAQEISSVESPITV